VSDYIDTREGWREVELPYDKAELRGREVLRLQSNGDALTIKLWVREVPVPPLPTEFATLDGADLVFLAEVVRALGVGKQSQR
jgi:hypothetical protein